MIRKYFALVVSLVAFSCVLLACSQESPVTNPRQTDDSKTMERGSFAKGADVSWLTQMENEGYSFTNKAGVPTECMKILKEDCGVNAIRLRVWVNPSDGWNNVSDVLVKARRANALGLRLMIDFHFSDTWADPGHQAIPASWENYTLDEAKDAVATHVKEMLFMLKKYNIEPEWVQIGNETRLGMMWPLGNIDNGGNFAELVTAGYDAVKEVFSGAKVIVHLDSGDNIRYYNYVFDNLKEYGGKYDMIGMSLYPEEGTWESMVNACVDNIKSLNMRYNVPVMVCEIGMDYNLAETCRMCISSLMSKGKATDCLAGIFYWEPQAPAGYNGGYNKGCFDNGTPTVALDAFK